MSKLQMSFLCKIEKIFKKVEGTSNRDGHACTFGWVIAGSRKKAFCSTGITHIAKHGAFYQIVGKGLIIGRSTQILR